MVSFFTALSGTCGIGFSALALFGGAPLPLPFASPLTLSPGGEPLPLPNVLPSVLAGSVPDGPGYTGVPADGVVMVVEICPNVGAAPGAQHPGCEITGVTAAG
jgi:hypothetical protein